MHVITYALFEWEAWFITKRAACIREIGLGEVLVMRVRIVEGILLKIGIQTFVYNIGQLIERTTLAGCAIVNSTGLRIERAKAAIDDVLYVNKIAFLLAMLEDAW